MNSWAFVFAFSGLAALAQERPAKDLILEAEKLFNAGTRASQSQAINLFKQAATKAQQEGDKSLEARALYRIGQGYVYMSSPQEGIDYLDKAIPIMHSLGERTSEGHALHNKAVGLYLLGDSATAIDTFQSALIVRRETKDPRGEALTLTGIANSHLYMGENAEALDFYRQALAVWQNLNQKRNEADTHNSIGNAYVQLGELDRAQAEFETALQLLRQVGGDRTLLDYARNNLGWIAIGRRQYQQALTHLDGLIEDFLKGVDRRGPAYVYHNLGSAHFGLHDLAKARDNFEHSLAIKREIGDPSGEAYTLQALGELALSEGKSDEALKQWTRALEIRRDIADANGLIVTLGSFARLHRQEKKPAAALREIQEAIQLIESRRSALASQDLRATYFSRKRDYYDLLTTILLEQGESASALESAERSKGRQLLDRLGDVLAGVRKNVDPALLKRERDLQRKINSTASRLQQTSNAASRQKTRDALQKLLSESRDLSEEIRRASPSYASLLENSPLDAKGIQALLVPREALIVYSLAENQGAVWLVTKNSLISKTIPGRRAIEPAVIALRNRISTKAEWKQESTKLFRMVCGPIEQALQATGSTRVIVSGDGPLESAPFNLLLGDRYEVAGLPSASALALLRKQPPVSSNLIAVLADPILDKEDARVPESATRGAMIGTLPRLRFSRDEANGIAALVPSSPKKIALDFDANRAFFDNASRARIIHLATHAIADSEHPELSGLALSRFDSSGRTVDGFLRLTEIYNLSLRARLVTLSACRSATGTELPGEGLISLTRGFLYAGASTVLATLWDVDDRATSELMKRFYRALLTEGQTPPGALRTAQRYVRAQEGWDHPYYWGAFTLQGEWR